MLLGDRKVVVSKEGGAERDMDSGTEGPNPSWTCEEVKSRPKLTILFFFFKDSQNVFAEP